MSFLYPFILFLLIPLYLLYKQSYSTHRYKQREKRLLFISLLFIIIALARPVIPNSLNKQKFDAQDFILAIDASYSMQATDIYPSRYSVAKENVKKIIKALPKNRFSIFAFTSNTILISPPTTDSAVSIMALDALEPQFILTKGTSLLALFKRVSKLSFKEKNLIIFSDGGEEKNLTSLVEIAQKNNIKAYIVATGSSSGSVLTKGDKRIKDENNNLVISRINPLLEDLAHISGGEYYELNHPNSNVAEQIIYDLNTKETTHDKSNINVLSYTELFWLPLFISILFFIISVTKIHQLYVLIPLLFLPYQAKASLFDFYYIDKAKQDFKDKRYLQSAQGYYRISPSVESYYNEAVAYYKAKDYRVAVDIFSKIKTKNPKLKQKIYYNMGNCAVMYGKYDRAKIYYKQALNIGFDKESYENLQLIYKLSLKEKRDLSNMLRKQKKDKQNTGSKKEKIEKDKNKKSKNKNSSSNANQKSAQKSNGSSNSKKKKIQEANKQTDKTIESKYKVGYRAYELINKGYTNEEHPW